MPTTRRLAWDDNYYLQTFLLTKQGNTEAKVRNLIGASEKTWKGWKVKRPALRHALKKGREARRTVVETMPDNDRAETFKDYVYGHLPQSMRRLWTEIESIADGDNERQDLMKETLRTQGVAFRQSLFIHALTTSRFDFSKALRKSMISASTYEKWMKDYPEFVALVKEINRHKSSYFENALLDAVQLGDTTAIIHANKTFNRDLGYGEKIEIEHTGSVTQTHAHLDLTKLDIPDKYKLLILRHLQSNNQPDDTPKLEDQS